MKTKIWLRWSSYVGLGVLGLAMIFTIACNSSQKKTGSAAVATPATFGSPVEAGQALLAAAQSNDQEALSRVLGARGKALVTSGDAVEDKAAMDSFARKYGQMNRWVAMTDGSQVLHIGADNYQFPIPVTKGASSKWQFDSTAGEEEITARNIGRNELLAIDAVSAIANAEELYFQNPHDGNPAGQYTQLIVSNPGKHDGLYWDVPAGQPSSPLGRVNDFLGGPLPVLAPGAAQVFDGYSFRILSAQGDKAEGGPKSYLANGKLTGGFAIIASPVKYRESGIMTFVLNREGVVYQVDLGVKTPEIVAAIDNYNPGDEWAEVE
jgi:Protein of unknown function (DUF2950)